MSARKGGAETIRITPPRGWFELNLREVWSYRELVYFFAWRDLKVRYKQTAIGASWAVIQPLIAMAVFTLIFGHALDLPSQGLPAPIFYFCGLLPWTYFANAIGHATNTMVENQRVITKVYFPRLVLPLSAVLPGLVDLAISFVVLIGLMIVYGIAPTAGVVFLPVFVILALLTALGAGLWLSAMNAVYRDVRYAVPFLIQIWFFVSPVVYPPDVLPRSVRWLYGLNPMAGVIDGFRWALTGAGKPPGAMVFVSSGAVVVLLLGGLAYFRRKETLIADVV